MAVTPRGLRSMLAAGMLASALTHASEQDNEINVVGLSSGTAVVVVGDGGKPRLLRDGDTLRSGVRLIKATPEGALFEINGKRRSLTLGNNQLANGHSAANGSGSVTLAADARGHFMTTGTINGATVQFLVDTGATMISLGLADARRIGLNYLEGERGITRTANGTARVYRVKLDSVRVGDITLNNIDALVHEADMPFVLLGMSFLNRVEMTRTGSDLTLTKRY
ncbi:MAG TPA: TIGR02281 family clan AA aspartic protease [Burkholderiales bacterium]|nr:TIGR02281 family clan AA aspartic protease [Burkholderiales bacterium]